ncbi:hypothetical protein [Cellulosilyticum lentocellum]|nr:hypothetical protein [Cellulosilyticum lentocellum]
MLLIICPIMAFCSTDAEVTIEVINQTALVNKCFVGDAIITFNNIELYNENVKFSYHIYDEEGNILVFENERIPFSLQGNVATISLNIDFDKYEQLKRKNKFVVKLDLVDEQNIYWFGDNAHINFKPYYIQYDLNTVSIAKQKYGQVIKNQKGILIMNIVFDITIVILFFMYKKKQR